MDNQMNTSYSNYGGYGRGNYGGRGRAGGFRGRGRGRGGFQSQNMSQIYQSQVNFWNEIETVSTYLKNKPLKVLRDDSKSYTNDYFTELTLTKMNKYRVKNGMKLLNDKYFETNGIMRRNFDGQTVPHNIASFFRTMDNQGFLLQQNVNGKVKIMVPDDYLEAINHRRDPILSNLGNTKKQYQDDESSSSSEEDEDEDKDKDKDEDEDEDEDEDKNEDKLEKLMRKNEALLKITRSLEIELAELKRAHNEKATTIDKLADAPKKADTPKDVFDDSDDLLDSDDDLLDSDED